MGTQVYFTRNFTRGAPQVKLPESPVHVFGLNTKCSAEPLVKIVLTSTTTLPTFFSRYHSLIPMPTSYISYIRDTFTLLLNTPLSESKSSSPPTAFPMINLSPERRSSLDSVSLSSHSSCSALISSSQRTTVDSTPTDDFSVYSSHSRTSSRRSGLSRWNPAGTRFAYLHLIFLYHPLLPLILFTHNLNSHSSYSRLLVHAWLLFK